MDTGLGSIIADVASGALTNDSASTSSNEGGSITSDAASNNSSRNTDSFEEVIGTDEDGNVDKNETANNLMEEQNKSTVENMVLTHMVNTNAERNKTLVASVKKAGEDQGNAARYSA